MSTYSIRAATPDDMVLVLDSWAKSLRLPTRHMVGGDLVEDDTFVELGPKVLLAPNLWGQLANKLVEQLVERSALAVAYHPSYSAVIVGWVAWEQADAETTTVHFVWVRPELRRQGVARQLLELVRGLSEGTRLRASAMSHAARHVLRSPPRGETR